jgi:hypothetical protein
MPHLHRLKCCGASSFRLGLVPGQCGKRFLNHFASPWTKPSLDYFDCQFYGSIAWQYFRQAMLLLGNELGWQRRSFAPASGFRMSRQIQA